MGIFPFAGAKGKQGGYNSAVMGSFAAFALSEAMVSALKKLGYESPSPVQERVIPKALSGKSLVCQSETGSGKTHSYLVPIIDSLDLNLPRLQSIIICPSRELARQVYEFAMEIGKYFPRFKVRLLTSEEEKTKNSSGLSIAPQMIVGTPGRLKDILISDYELDLHGVRSMVLDEADMLMELGYFDDIDAIYSLLGERVQTMVFSATLEQSLKNKLERYIGSSFLYEGEDFKTAKLVSHHLVDIRHASKLEALEKFLEIRHPYLALVFASKKEDVKAIYQGLREDDIPCIMFSGDLDARERKQALRAIKANKHAVIVCSDLLARGIDIEDVSDVISLDLPQELEYYYHRAGRTGRFGKTGDSWVFYDSDSTKKPQELLSKGQEFDYYVLKGSSLSADPVGLAKKRKFTKKREFGKDEAAEVKMAKARTRGDQVKPGYKKKQKDEIEKVKRKYRRKAIQAAVKKHKDEKYRRKAKLKGQGE